MRLAALLLIVGTFAALTGLAVRHIDGTVEFAAVDARFRVRGNEQVTPEIVLVTLDNATLDAFNEQPPLLRSHYAALIRRLRDGGAAVIALDFNYRGVTFPEEDLALINGLRRHPGVVVSVTSPDRNGIPEPLAGIARFQNVGATPGYTALPVDSDGAIRRPIRPVERLDGFGAAIAQAARGSERIVPPPRALIDYPGPSGSFPSISMSAVLERRVEARSLRGKIVIVGPTATVFSDVHRVPVDGTMPGVELQAAAVQTALSGFPLRYASPSTTVPVTVGLGFFVPLLLALAAIRKPPSARVYVGSTAAAMAAWLLASQLAFEAGTVLEVVPGLTAILVSAALAVVARKRLREQARQRFLAADDDFVDRVLADPEDLLGSAARSIIGGYELLERIPGGGMGRVFKARQGQLDRDVAIKLIDRGRAEDPRYRAAFLNEGVRAAKVQHHHVVPVIEAGEDGGRLFIAMWFLAGADLETRLRDQHYLDPPEAAALLHRVGLALESAARRRIVHCDIKPANIMFDEDPEHPYVTDFGIAWPAGLSLGTAIGTPAYISPEQIAGGQITARTDIYALGAVMFECLTGETPFAGSRADVLHAHQTAARPQATGRNRRLPEAIDPILARAMAINPSDRYASATDFTREALAVLHDVPSRPRPDGSRFESGGRTETI